MSWFLGEERRGPSWKIGWTERTLSSLRLPPSPLLAVVGIIVVLMSLSSYSSFKSQEQHTMMGFRLLGLLFLLGFIFVAHSVTRYGAVLVVSPRTKAAMTSDGGGGGGSPWSVMVLLFLVVVLLSYQSYIHSKWFPLLWRSNTL